METINNNQMSEYTTYQRSFTTNTKSVFTVNNDYDDIYVVYSYGFHFPMYVYDCIACMWFGNEDKYSRTTTRHQTLAKPDVATIEMLPTKELIKIIRAGGYTAYCADRCVGDNLGFKLGKIAPTKTLSNGRR